MHFSLGLHGDFREAHTSDHEKEHHHHEAKDS
jgi:hypothetical protein